VKYAWIDGQRGQYPLAAMCQALTVSTSGLATWRRGGQVRMRLANILNPHLKGRRLFLSACSMVHEDLAKEIIPNSGCNSVVGPNEDILFSDAAILWSSIYHLMFSYDSNSMKHKWLKKQLKSASQLFQVDISYYSRSKKLSRGYTSDLLKK